MRYSQAWPVYAKQWDRMKINRTRVNEFEHLAQFAVDHKVVYQAVEKATGVPYYLVAALHRRESDANFRTYLGNGDSLARRTVHVPRGRGPFPNFQAGAIDALRLDGLSKVVDWRIEKVLYYCELFNGFGYAAHGRPSPYVFGGTNIQQAGKYIADGRWSSTAWDTQPGCAPMIKTIAELDPSVKFTREE